MSWRQEGQHLLHGRFDAADDGKRRLVRSAMLFFRDDSGRLAISRMKVFSTTIATGGWQLQKRGLDGMRARDFHALPDPTDHVVSR